MRRIADPPYLAWTSQSEKFMEKEERKLVQRLGEDTAYTFKGLYKESDWLKYKYRFYLSIPIVCGLVSLGIHQHIPELWLKILAVVSLVLIFLALLGQKQFESVNSYRRLADKIKTIYDLAEEAYLLNEFENYNELREQWSALREETQKYPIGVVGRFLSERRIKTEMNLSWLGGEYGKQ